MTVQLSVADVRAALATAAGTSAVGSGDPATLLLGRIFHEMFADLISRDPRKSGLRVVAEGDDDPRRRSEQLLGHAWRELLAPRLRRQAASVQSSTEPVLTLWKATAHLTEWLGAVVGELLEQRPEYRGNWEGLESFLQAEVPLACELEEPGWSERVRLVGLADSVLRVPGRTHLCAIELKLGRARPVVDLGQAALYHLIVTRSDRSLRGTALALMRFSPQLDEHLVEADALQAVEGRLLDLIGKLAGVASIGVASASAPSGGTFAGAPSGGTRRSEPTIVGGGPSDARAPSADMPLFADAPLPAPAVTSMPPVPVAVPVVAAVPAPVVDAASPVATYADLGKRLVRAYREHGVGIEVRSAAQVGPRFLRFDVRLAQGTLVGALIKRTREVQHRLELRTEPLVTQHGGRLFIDLERPDPATVLFSSVVTQLPPVDALAGSAKIAIGVDASGRLHTADLASAGRSHVLAAGTTGSGKSEWLRMMLASLLCTNTPETLRLVTLDPKLAAFADLERSPYLWRPDAFWIPGSRPASDLFQELIEEMEERYLRLRDVGADNLADYVEKTGRPMARIVCVCDEYFALVAQDKDEKKEIELAVGLLGAKARAAGIHLLLALQQPSRAVLSGVIQANLPCRVALALQSPIESRMILSAAGAERLTGSGDLLYKDFGEPVRLQAPFLPEAERLAYLRR